MMEASFSINAPHDVPGGTTTTTTTATTTKHSNYTIQDSFLRATHLINVKMAQADITL